MFAFDLKFLLQFCLPFSRLDPQLMGSIRQTILKGLPIVLVSNDKLQLDLYLAIYVDFDIHWIDSEAFIANIKNEVAGLILR